MGGQVCGWLGGRVGGRMGIDIETNLAQLGLGNINTSEDLTFDNIFFLV